MGDLLAAKRAVQAIAKVEIKRSRLSLFKYTQKAVLPFFQVPVDAIQVLCVLPGGTENQYVTIFRTDSTTNIIPWIYKYGQYDWKADTDAQIEEMVNTLAYYGSQMNTRIQIPPLL